MNTSDAVTSKTAGNEIVVWDPFVRVAHWAIAIAFFVAYFTEAEALTVHVWAGYTIGALVVVRVAWGFIGGRYAKFSDFIYQPRSVIGYLADLIKRHAKRYVGHSPAGGAMVIALLVFLAATVTSGLVVYALEDNRGLLAGILTSGVSTADEDGPRQLGEESEEGESLVLEVHEIFANITLALVVFHILGVIFASFIHKENLAWAMITGRKRDLMLSKTD